MALKIAGNAGPNIEVETNTLAARVVVRPDDYGTQGIYALGGASGTITAGMAAGSSVFAFRYAGSSLCIIKKVVVSAGGTATTFTAGLVNFSLFAARSFSAIDTGGTSLLPNTNTNSQRLRTSMAATAVGTGNIVIANTGALTPGSRTLDSQPLAQIESSVPATAGTPLVPPFALFDQRVGEYPLVCTNNEGVVLQGTVPATGTWVLAVSIAWEELSTYGTGLAS